MKFLSILERAKVFAEEAGRKALEMQKHLESIRFKNPKDVVTSADLESERIIISHLQEEFPDHSIRTEEAGHVKDGSRYEWIIDPVDGTVNFSRGIPLWGVSIALVENTENGAVPIVAAISLPGLGKIYTASKNGGAFVNGERIHVSETADLSKAIVSNGDFNVGNWEKINAQNLKNFQREAENCTRVKCYGSAVIEGTFTAQGSLDAFVMTMSYPWDIAGIALIVTEAGGKATEISGDPIRFVDGEQVLFSNGILHDQMVQILK
ncbi:MAG: inositol monophosphatase [Hallerella porci]|uniref:inositol monophosphatase family protein n=1 Tax=Hallerella TaxID=2815788 RepID=UPI0025871C67|nr:MULTISPECIES: inositol monophosphatase [Hallerella]MCI5601243.1 inositol monophosphatase [Hallerella sp.]MDY3922680.1 inositol monophosphatase [Hallerella porci]